MYIKKLNLLGHLHHHVAAGAAGDAAEDQHPLDVLDHNNNNNNNNNTHKHK